MVGIEIATDVIEGNKIVDECLRNGLLVNFTGDTVIRLMPPLTIEPNVLEEGVRILLDVFNSADIGVP
jgi:acetylornithine/succinyldiaminopimelate/putrescine aminotransferase